MRKKAAEKKYFIPDPKYKDPLVTRFVNNLMLQGKKNKAYKVFYASIEKIEKKNKDEQIEETGIEVWKRALSNVTPNVEVKSRRVGGATLQVPRQVYPDRRLSLSIKWLIRFARKRNEHTIIERLTQEILLASKGEGGAVKKKNDTHRMAEANKAFAHFR